MALVWEHNCVEQVLLAELPELASATTPKE